MRNEKWRMQNGSGPVIADRAVHFAFSIFHFSFCIAFLLPPAQATADEPNPKLTGSASCATAACHGGLGGHKFVGAEFPVWSERDPHARAYSVLLNDLSRQMAEQLKLPKPAHESAVCLNCHSPATSNESKMISITGRKPLDGVDCEQCHGPAEHWLTEHVRTDWKHRPADDKRRRGYRDLTDVLTRANTCADCHVGASGRDVNHDLIAAGHPRLFFELATFHANWPKHWPEETDAKRHPVAEKSAGGSIFEAKLWAVGQVVTAQRSLELLILRTELAKDSPTKWPELAEWNCFACHHDLQSASRWQSKDGTQRPRVSFRLNSWPYAMLDSLARPNSDAALPIPSATLKSLQQHFASPLPPAGAIARDAASAVKSLRLAAERLNRADAAKESLSSESLAALRLSLVTDHGPQLVSRDWDSATQLFLSLNAIQQAIIAAKVSPKVANPALDHPIQEVLDSMNETLNFQPGLRSPRDFAAPPIERLQSDLRTLQKLLSRSQ